MGLSVQPQNHQGFILWFKTKFLPNAFLKSGSNPQTLCSEGSLSKHVKDDYNLLVVKILAPKK